MPPTERSVLLRSATFAPGRTFKNYISHLRKGRGRALLGAPSDWATKAAYASTEGLRKARKGTSKFPNILFMADVFNLSEFSGRCSEFALLASISLLFAPRVPSVALHLRMAFRDDPIAGHVGQSEKALICVRAFKGRDALVIKMAWRKNLEGGCVIKRTCIFCPDLSHPACPPRGVWPRIRGRINAGSLCFSSYFKNNFNQHLKFVLRKMDLKDAPRYTSKAFRMGAAQELLQHGSTIAAIKSS